MARIEFADLIPIYRNTRFDGHGGGVLTVADAGIAETLRAIEADSALFDEAQLSLTVPAEPVVGSEVTITVAAPKLSLGILASDFDHLFRSPKAAFEEPANYYVINPGYAVGDQPVPPELAKYRALLKVVSVLREAAAYVDEVKRDLVFIETEKVIVPIVFTMADLPNTIEAQANRLTKIFHDALHGDEKAGLLSTTVAELVSGQREKQRFAFLIANLERVCDEVEKGYKLFVSSFSYSKIRNDVETARLDFINKIHKTIVDIQGQLLGIPVATIVVASQLKQSVDCGVTFWSNLAVILGAWIFVGLLVLAVINQWHTLTAIAGEVKGQRARLADDYAAVSVQFIGVFDGLKKRICWHRGVLAGVMICALLGVGLATLAFLMLTENGSSVCLTEGGLPTSSITRAGAAVPS